MAAFLHRDHLGSVRAITDAAGAVVERAVYQPYGEQTEALASSTAPESKGWIGERYDADAGLQYLNARYYDPVMGLFLQPDWFEVTEAGVGTNRYGYSFGDPVNASDPGGNAAVYSDTDGDGDNEYAGQINPGDPGYGDDFSKSGIQASEWVSYNDAARGTNVSDGSSGAGIFGGGNIQIPITEFDIRNPAFIAKNPKLAAIAGNPAFFGLALEALQRSNYLAGEIVDMREISGWLVVNTENGSLTATFYKSPSATFKSSTIQDPPSLGAHEITAHYHTHPASGLWYTDAQGKTVTGFPTPSPDDYAAAAVRGPGFVIAGNGSIYGYTQDGRQ